MILSIEIDMDHPGATKVLAMLSRQINPPVEELQDANGPADLWTLGGEEIIGTWEVKEKVL